MIAGVANQQGTKEGLLIPKFLPDSQPGFSDVLKALSGSRKNAASARALGKKPLIDSHLGRDTLLKREEEQPERREDTAALDQTSPYVQAQATPAAGSIQKASVAKPPSPTREKPAVDLPAQALQQRDSGVGNNSEIGRPGSVAATGWAAYKLARHGGDEKMHAAAAGITPLGETLNPEQNPVQGLEKLHNDMLWAKPPEDKLGKAGDKNLPAALDLFNLSRKPGTPPTSQGESPPLLQQELESAQARQELLTRLGGNIQSAEPQANPATLSTALLASRSALAGKDNAAAAPPLKPEKSAVLQTADALGALPGTGTTGATAARKLAKTPDRLIQQEVLDRIAEQGRWVLRNNRSEVHFKLSPEQLGDVHLKVTQSEGMLKVDMTVESHWVKQMVESRLDELQLRLQEENLDAENFSFNVDVRQDDDSKHPEGFTLRASNPASGSAAASDETPLPEQLTDRFKPIWGKTGSGIYA